MNKALLKVTELTTYYISLLFVLFRFMLTGIAGLNYFIFIALSILAGVSIISEFEEREIRSKEAKTWSAGKYLGHWCFWWFWFSNNRLKQ